MSYYIEHFNRDENGDVLAKALADLYWITVEASIYKEDGEDPLIKAHVTLEYTKERGGETGQVFLHMPNSEITEDDIYKAIEEYMGGSKGCF